ncbi:hypothetical protein EC533_04355 [Helicobacter pylori]|nr:hypothetical protein EC533_04355 [Helicobacter pylori]
MFFISLFKIFKLSFSLSLISLSFKALGLLIGLLKIVHTSVCEPSCLWIFSIVPSFLSSSFCGGVGFLVT